MKNLIGNINEGYKIIKQGEIAVIAESEEVLPYTNEKMYVAWHYKIDPFSEVSYFWGRYGSLEYVKDCFYKKQSGIYSGD
jgi:hypothetical protein